MQLQLIQSLFSFFFFLKLTGLGGTGGMNFLYRDLDLSASIIDSLNSTGSCFTGMGISCLSARQQETWRTTLPSKCFKRTSTVNTLDLTLFISFQGTILKHWSTITTFLRGHFIFLHLCFITLWFTIFVDIVVGKCLIKHIFLCYTTAFMKDLYSAY